jgi:hypothetical protein
MENLQPIDFRSLEGQLLALEAVNCGDLRYVDAYRLCFPEDEKTLESMELRELIDNRQLYRGNGNVA